MSNEPKAPPPPPPPPARPPEERVKGGRQPKPGRVVGERPGTSGGACEGPTAEGGR